MSQQLSYVKRALNAAMFAGTATALMAASAHATVIVVTPPTPISIGATIDGVYLNVVTGVSGATAALTPGWDINPYSSSTGFSFFSSTGGGYVGVGSAVSALSVGTSVSSASAFITGALASPDYRVTGQEYVGFRFLNESTGATNYGWALISTTATLGFPAAIVSYAYENTGAGLTVGPVPEPSTYAMMGLGIAGLALLARRRKV